MADSLKFDSKSLIAELEKLGKSAGTVIHPATQSGAQVLYDEVKARLVNRQKTGNLYNSIYQVYSKSESTPGIKTTFQVSWNAKKAPHGHLIENGTSRAPAHPFIRPAYDAVYGKAEQTVKATFSELMQTEIDKAGA